MTFFFLSPPLSHEQVTRQQEKNWESKHSEKEEEGRHAGRGDHYRQSSAIHVGDTRQNKLISEAKRPRKRKSCKSVRVWWTPTHSYTLTHVFLRWNKVRKTTERLHGRKDHHFLFTRQNWARVTQKWAQTIPKGHFRYTFQLSPPHGNKSQDTCISLPSHPELFVSFRLLFLLFFFGMAFQRTSSTQSSTSSSSSSVSSGAR